MDMGGSHPMEMFNSMIEKVRKSCEIVVEWGRNHPLTYSLIRPPAYSTVLSRSSFHRLALILLLWLAFALRLFRLQDASVWWDEGFSVWEARMGLLALADRTAYDVHPPFYYWLLHFWRLWVGDGEFALRYLSVIFGVLTLAALWALARRLAPKQPEVALAGVALLAVSRYAIWWSQEIRMYALTGFFVVLSLYFMVRLRQRFRWRWAVGYVLVTAALLWSLYTLAFLLIIEGLYWLWTLRRASVWRERGVLLLQWAGLQIAVLALFLPWLWYALPRMWRWSVQDTFDTALFLRLYATMLHVGASLDIDTFWPAVSVALLMVGAGSLVLLARKRYRTERDGVVLLVLMLAIPPLALWLMTSFPNAFGYSPRVQARYFFPFAPTYYLLAAWSVFALAGLLTRYRLPVAILMLSSMVLLQGWGLNSYYAGRFLKDDYKSAALTLNAHRQANDAVVLHTDAPWPVFAYHFPDAFTGVPNGQEATHKNVEHLLRPIWESHDALWLMLNEDALRADKDQLVENWLAERAAGVHEWRYGNKRLILFARTSQRTADLLALGPSFQPTPPPTPLQANGATLVGWEQPLQRLRAGEPVHVAATIEQTGTATEITLTLGDPPLTSAFVTLAPATGRQRLPLSLLIPYQAQGRQPVMLSLNGAATTIGWIEVIGGRAETIQAVEIAPEISTSITFGDPSLAELVGYNLGEKQTPGETMTITLYWRVLNPSDRSYKVFIHLIGPDGRPIAQGDNFPMQGDRPTTTWQPGETLIDNYTIALPPDLSPGSHPLRIGFYDPSTNERLTPVLDAEGKTQVDGQVELEILEIR